LGFGMPNNEITYGIRRREKVYSFRLREAVNYTVNAEILGGDFVSFVQIRSYTQYIYSNIAPNHSINITFTIPNADEEVWIWLWVFYSREELETFFPILVWQRNIDESLLPQLQALYNDSDFSLTYTLKLMQN